MDFLQKIIKVGKFFFAFTDDYSDFMKQQEISKIGKNRTANYVRIDENGASYKQYVNIGIADVERKDVVNTINLRLSKFSNRKPFIFLFIFALFVFAGSLLVIIFNLIEGLEGNEDMEMFYIMILSFVLSSFGLIFLLTYFMKNKKAYLVYDISPDREQQTQTFYDELFKLEEAKKVWVVKDEDRHGDGRRHAGATSAVSLELTGIYHSRIKGLETNARVPAIGNHVYFFPDALFIYSGKKIRTISYKDIEVQLSTSQFREDGEIPSDAEKIGSTWKFVNNDGNPDRRFDNNRKIPILKYCGIKITGKNGFSLSLIVSNYEIGKNFANTIHAYKQKA
ncbi:MAG: hypothetical protein LBH43_18780 [Treponema sp.]|jgi:hypothetical protein|nr:hypothetical protein [Treponema sp.]